MNRRAVITGAATLAASTVVPVALAQPVFADGGLEFATLVVGLPPEKKLIAAAQFRLMAVGVSPASADLLNRLADLVEGMGRHDGATGSWRGYQDMDAGVVALAKVDPC